ALPGLSAVDVSRLIDLPSQFAAKAVYYSCLVHGLTSRDLERQGYITLALQSGLITRYTASSFLIMSTTPFGSASLPSAIIVALEIHSSVSSLKYRRKVMAILELTM